MPRTPHLTARVSPPPRAAGRCLPFAVLLAAPVGLASILIGCPHRAEGVPDSAVSAAPSRVASAAPSNPAWPKVVVIPDPVDASVAAQADVAGETDAPLPDADLDADGDVSDGDARKSDAAEDAPLLGTKTFPDEVPARGIRKITSSSANVHKAPKDGTGIASLPKGTEVSLVAELNDWYRVRFTDPVGKTRRQGWIYVLNFIGPRMKTCPVDWTHHEQEGGWCDRECVKNADCKAIKGYKCSGTRCFYAAD